MKIKSNHKIFLHLVGLHTYCKMMHGAYNIKLWNSYWCAHIFHALIFSPCRFQFALEFCTLWCSLLQDFLFLFLLWLSSLSQFVSLLCAKNIWCLVTESCNAHLVTFDQTLRKCYWMWRILMAILIHDIYETMSSPFLHTLSGYYTWDVLRWFIWIDASSPYIDQPENIDLVISSSDRLHGSVLFCKVDTVLLFSCKIVKRFIDLTPGLYFWSVSCRRIVIGET